MEYYYYYFFSGVQKINKIWEWFNHKYRKDPRINLMHTIPVTFQIDNTVYSIKYKEKWDIIYCIRMYGQDSHNHSKYLLDIENFLNKLKETKY